MKNTQRLQILSEHEVLAIYSRPIFNELEQRHYFSLSELELADLGLRTVNGKDTSSKLYFILQLGYFKANHLFFQFNYILLIIESWTFFNTRSISILDKEYRNKKRRRVQRSTRGAFIRYDTVQD